MAEVSQPLGVGNSRHVIPFHNERQMTSLIEVRQKIATARVRFLAWCRKTLELAKGLWKLLLDMIENPPRY